MGYTKMKQRNCR